MKLTWQLNAFDCYCLLASLCCCLRYVFPFSPSAEASLLVACLVLCWCRSSVPMLAAVFFCLCLLGTATRFFCLLLLNLVHLLAACRLLASLSPLFPFLLVACFRIACACRCSCLIASAFYRTRLCFEKVV